MEYFDLLYKINKLSLHNVFFIMCAPKGDIVNSQMQCIHDIITSMW